ncbi:MAG: hypothetical protein ABIR94_12940 [Rubrivivax sp.]
MTNLKSPLTTLSLALSLAMPLGARALDNPNAGNNYGGQANSQNSGYIHSSGLQVNSFSVSQQRELTPGSELLFSLVGTPGASVNLKIDGATGGVDMTEVGSGQYRGNYTVRTRDRLDARSVVTAHMLKDGRFVDVKMDQSMVIGARSPAAQPTANSRITAFDIDAPANVRPGD